MRKKIIEVSPWTIGSTVVSNTTDFGITEGKEYTVLKYGVFPGNFVIVDDTGKEVEYSEDYFDMK
jgi:hypothetical protein